MIKDIYIMRIDGVWYGYAPRKKYSFTIIGGESLEDFYHSIKEDFPDYRIRCVRNLGLEEKLRKVKLNSEEMFYISRQTLTK